MCFQRYYRIGLPYVRPDIAESKMFVRLELAEHCSVFFDRTKIYCSTDNDRRIINCSIILIPINSFCSADSDPNSAIKSVEYVNNVMASDSCIFIEW